MGERYNEGEVVAEEAGTEKAAERKIGFMSRVYESTPVRAIGFVAAGGAAVLGTVIPAKAQTQNGEITKSEISAECRPGDDIPGGNARLIHTISTSHEAHTGLFGVREDATDGSIFSFEIIDPEEEHSFDLSWEEELPDGTESVELYHGANFDLDGGFGGGGRDVERTEEEEQYVDFTEPVELVYPCEDENNNEEEENVGGPTNPAELDRWAGSTRTETSIKISRNTYDEAENAVLTTSQDFPDALAGTPLAAASEGPLLLTGSEELHEGVAGELERLGVNHVYVLGGNAAISEHVENQLGSRGYQVTRLGGDDRLETASIVASELQTLTEQSDVVDDDPETDTATNDPETDTVTSDPETDTAQTPEDVDNEVLLADGGDFADALAGGSLGAQEGSPILLTPSESLHPTTEEYLQSEQVDRVTILGGSAAVSESVEREAAAAADTEDVDRLAGSTRIDTAIEIAREKLDRSGDRVVNAYFASAYDWPDALAGGHTTSQEGDVLLLVNGHDANPALDPFIAEQRPDVERDQWETVTILGGTAAISEEEDLIFRVNAHPTSDDSSTTSNDSSLSAITTEVATNNPAEAHRSEEVVRRDEINPNTRAVVTYDANGEPQVELKNAA